MSLRSVTIQIPGTCGEWIQTVSRGRECLVSLPIDEYTEVKVGWASPEVALRSYLKLMPKSQSALALIGKELALSPKQLASITVDISRELAIGKGMASSTADLAGIIKGVSSLVEVPITPEKILSLCCQIEASDGIMFDRLALIDHLEGTVLESFETFLPVDILMLVPDSQYETSQLREESCYLEKLSQKTEIPLTLFKKAMLEQSLFDLGKASIQSLLENERILTNHYLKSLIELSALYDCYGVVGGHSGTISGLLINDKKTDREALLAQIKSMPLGGYYTKHKFVKTVRGGIVCTKMED